MRQGVAPLVGLTTYVSIHASVKDATSQSRAVFKKLCCFNPRICKRCDKVYPLRSVDKTVSIHASVKDATFVTLLCSVVLSFNPRICKRCDSYKHQTASWQNVSIHASVKDATAGPIMGTPTMMVSIHASVKDATYRSRRDNIISRFQSTHL